MQVFKLHAGDLSTDTLKSIKNDLWKYSHLAAYKGTYKVLSEIIDVREKEDRKRDYEARKQARQAEMTSQSR